MNIITLYRQTSESLKSVRLHTLLKINYHYFFFLLWVVYSTLQLNFRLVIKTGETENDEEERLRMSNNTRKWFTYNGINFIIARTTHNNNKKNNSNRSAIRLFSSLFRWNIFRMWLFNCPHFLLLFSMITKTKGILHWFVWKNGKFFKRKKNLFKREINKNNRSKWRADMR